MNIFKAAKNFLFGGTDIVTGVSDVADKWFPSKTTQHNQSIENEKAGDESQDSARGMVMVSHDGLIDVLVDAANRLVRPVVTFWIIGGLMGLWMLPKTSTIDPVMLNIAWTVITFWFGSRVIFKDIPNAWKILKALKK